MFDFKTNRKKISVQIRVIITCSCFKLSASCIFINEIMDTHLHCSKIHLSWGTMPIDVGWSQPALFCVTRRSRGRNYEAELQKCRSEAILVEFGEYHPLKAITVWYLSLSWLSDLIANIPVIFSTRAFSPHATLQMGLHPLKVWSLFWLS